MVTKDIRELHFDNCAECTEFQEMYKGMGYQILRVGLKDDWFFKCSKILK